MTSASVQPVAQESSSEFNQSSPAKTRPSWQGTANNKVVPVADADMKAKFQMQVVPFGEFLHKKFNQGYEMEK